MASSKLQALAEKVASEQQAVEAEARRMSLMASMKAQQQPLGQFVSAEERAAADKRRMLVFYYFFFPFFFFLL